MALRANHAEALRLAMRRLIGGDAGQTDGTLTWTNVYTLAEVPKATAYRASELRDEWAALVKARRELAAAGAAAKKVPDSPTALRRTMKIMANHIQALSLAVAELEAEVVRKDGVITGLRAELNVQRVPNKIAAAAG